MGYIRAEEVLPREIIELIQQYVEGECIYIPKKSANRLKWGSNTDTRKELLERNRKIYSEYLEGSRVSVLACKYYLSEKTIYRIIRTMK